MRESIHALRCDLLCLQDAQSKRTRSRYACANLHIGLFTWFSRHNFRTRHFYENRHFKNEASVALNPLVLLVYLFVARGGKKRGNRRTDGQSDVQTERLL